MDLARRAQFEWSRMDQWEAAGVLLAPTSAFCLLLFGLAPMPGAAHQLVMWMWSALIAGGVVAWALARGHRTRRDRSAPGRRR